jgi:hypothetical protein
MVCIDSQKGKKDLSCIDNGNCVENVTTMQAGISLFISMHTSYFDLFSCHFCGVTNCTTVNFYRDVPQRNARLGAYHPLHTLMTGTEPFSLAEILVLYESLLITMH